MNEAEKLTTAERRARALHTSATLVPGDGLSLDIADDPDGWALLAAARAAACLNAVATVRLATPAEPSPTWTSLLPGCLRFARKGEGKPEKSTAFLSNGRSLPIPDADAAWATTLATSAPRVRLDNANETALSYEESRAIDRLAIEEYGVPGLCLMENAALGATAAAMDMLRDNAEKGVLVVAGGGNNGGDGLAMARGFRALGVRVEVALMKPARTLTGDALTNHALLAGTDVTCRELAPHPELLESLAAGRGLVVDALLGTGFRGALSPVFLEAVERINASGAPVLAVDIPSGLDGDTGAAAQTAVRAQRTVTFAAAKKGLRNEAARQYVGELYVADIGFCATFVQS